MGFLDEVVITASSGKGGNGCVSFRREKYIPKGGPDGGNGGNGGNIVLRATRKLYSLFDYAPRKHLKAGNGKPGKGKNQSGKNGVDLVLEVPVGTIVQDIDTQEILADLIHDSREILLIPGGRGGKGNRHFSTSTNRTPRFAQPGEPGQEKRLGLSLKFLADIGLIGLPNAGKSTLLSLLSTARPKVGSYPFTTLIPNLGTLIFDDDVSLIMADIPGLIKGAGQGRGLGHRFLKHIERTKFLLHLLDITYKPEQDLLEDLKTINNEMTSYDPALAKKPQIVLINKMDLYKSGHRDLGEIQEKLEDLGLPSLPISALTGQGLEKLKESILEKWTSFYGDMG